MDQVLKTIAPHIGTTLGYVLVAVGVYLFFVIKAWCRSRSNELCVCSEIKVAQTIHRQIAHIAGLAHGERALLLRFHNGGYFMNGDSILKLSCASEFTNQGVASVADRFVQMLVSTIPEAVEDLLRPTEDMMEFNIRKQTAQQCGCWSAILKHMGVDSWMMLPIFQDGRIIGVVMIAWAHEPDAEYLAKSTEEILKALGAVEFAVNNPGGCDSSGTSPSTWIEGFREFFRGFKK